MAGELEVANRQLEVAELLLIQEIEQVVLQARFGIKIDSFDQGEPQDDDAVAAVSRGSFTTDGQQSLVRLDLVRDSIS